MNNNFDYLEEELIEDFPEKDKTRALRRYNKEKQKNGYYKKCKMVES